MLQKGFLFFSLLIIGFSGCTDWNTGTPTAFTSTPTVSVLPSTPMFLPTMSPSSTNVQKLSHFSQGCVNLASIQLPPPIEASTVEPQPIHMLLMENFPPSAESPYLLNPVNAKTIPVIGLDTNEITSDTYVSPNKQNLAFDAYTNRDLVRIYVSDMKGRVLKSIFWEKDWGKLEGWLDDDHLLVTTRYIPVYPDLPHDDRLPRLIVLGISDNSRSELSAIDYPKINEVDVLNYLYWPINLAIYDPTLTYAAYPSETKDGAINLFYLPEQKIIASQPSLTASTGVPRWSPDYRYLAVAGISSNKHHNNQDLFLLDKDGHITQLTHLAEDLDPNVSIGLFSWSPDGKNIAFWYWVGDNREKHLAVYQFATETVTDFCVIDGKSGFGTFPVWSPDSQMVVVNTADNNESPYKIVWLNIFTAEGAVMQSSATVHGWLVKP